MKNWKIASAVLMIILVAIEAVFALRSNVKKEIGLQQETDEKQAAYENFHSALHLDKSFYGNLDVSGSNRTADEKILGGITSHHFLVSKKIANFFSSLKKQSPKTVVIIGPNHYNVGKSDVVVSRYPYKTPWGWLQPDNNAVDELLEKKIAANDEEPFSKEHSISALVGFIKYYLPESKIVPVILKRNISKERSQNLGIELNKILSDNSVVVASVDFSHHLNDLASKFHDQKSVAAISNFDYDGIYQSEIDSPGSICAMEKYLELKNSRKISYENINSAEFLGNPAMEDVTSYLFARFFKGMPEKNDAVSILNLGAICSQKKENALDGIAGAENNFFKGVDFIFSSQEIGKEKESSCFKKYNINQLSDILDGNKYAIKDIRGKKIGFLAVNLDSEKSNVEEYYSQAEELRNKSDYVLADVRWTSKNRIGYFEKQREVSHRLAESGADVVIGHLPGEMQAAEIYQNKAIFYSLEDIALSKNSEFHASVGIGIVFGGEKSKFYIFPYKFENNSAFLLKKDEFKIFCSDYLKNTENKRSCYFEK